MKQKTYITEELSKEDIKEIRKAIRIEIAKIFFDLYRKRGTWYGVQENKMYNFTWQIWSNRPENKKLISENMEKAKKKFNREKFLWEERTKHLQNQHRVTNK